MPSGSVLHGYREGVHVLRFVGDVRYPIAPSLSEYLSRLFDDDAGGVSESSPLNNSETLNLTGVERWEVGSRGGRCGVQTRCASSSGMVEDGGGFGGGWCDTFGSVA